MTLRRNLVVPQGATFSNDMPYQHANGANVDVTGATGRGKFRLHHESNTSTNLTIALSNGLITVSLTANATAAANSNLYVYDVEVVAADGTVTRAYEGKLNITPESTR